jgi:predicted AlkP superfamily phosphohydrolase/phosphomutase
MGAALIGIDGGSFDLARGYVVDGVMPNLAELCDAGSWGVLDSTFPAHTAPGWPSMLTGVNPGEHGIYQFWDTQDPTYGSRISSSSDWAREPLWRTAERHGLRCGVVNVPMSHPPQRLENGYMFTWPLAKTLHYAEPRSLLRELAEVGGLYDSDLATMYRGQPDYLEQAKEFIRARTRGLVHLLQSRPVDLLLTVFTEVDRVSHHFWGDGERPGDEVREIYAAFDGALGELVEVLPDDWLVVVASDHGFGSCRADFNVHTVLRAAGLFSEQATPDGAEHSAACCASWFHAPAERTCVDWRRTVAYMPTPGCFGVNLNLRGRQREGIVDDGAGADAARRTVTDALEAVRLDGRPVVRVVPREEIYWGARIEDAPDLVLLPLATDVMPHPRIGVREVWSSPTQSGIHRQEGLLALKGAPSTRPGPWKIWDVAPTMLDFLGLPVPSGDGRSIVGDTATVEPAVGAGPGRDRSDDGEVAIIERALENLGYL